MNTYKANTNVDFGRGFIKYGTTFEAKPEWVQDLIDNGAVTLIKGAVKQDAPDGNSTPTVKPPTKKQMVAELEALGLVAGEDFDDKANHSVLLERLELARADDDTPPEDEGGDATNE